MRRTAALIVSLAVLLAACGTGTIKPHGAEQVVVNVVSGQTGFRPTDVRCPSGVEAKVGVTFDCHFTGPEGPYTAHMRIRKVQGERVLFSMHSQPSAAR
ncbi:MAG TPA: DUF4333 domain-containing protein [Solirubrobacteraceae bacterium]|nr:DUF4333 domain-containing protein [Solirubrobacteraceae bacterium]